jgi:hypothetical protein
MPQTADQTVTIRLPLGQRDRLVALTGQPFSRLMRFMVAELIKAEEAKLVALQQAGLPASGDARVDVRSEIADVVDSAGDLPPE